MPAFRVCDVLVGIGNADPGPNRRARIVCDGGEIAPFVSCGLRPRHGYRTMPRDSLLRRYGRQLVELLEPTNKTAVDDRDAIDKQQIGEPERPRLFIENRQVIVGMRRTVGRTARRRPPRSRSSRVGTRTVGITTSLPSASLPRASRSRRR